MLIVLLRHGEPTALSDQAIYASDMNLWVSQYNNAPLNSKSLPSDPALFIASQCNLIVSSDLVRSKDSAAMLSSFQPIVENPIFSEAGLPYVKRKYFKAKPKLWLVVFRVLWYLGYSNGSESRAEAKTRSEKATLVLIDQAVTRQCIILAGHGIFNRFLAKELLKQGFKGPRNTSSDYWGFNTYERE